ncbi:MAG: hypothetical protein E7058_06040 [Lentisphaerae bacterium]|nr:hypothetical protein [Lentisphaerota bacterium]
MFRINCPHCGQELEVQDDWQGMNSSCPTCQNNFIIPVLSAPVDTKKRSPLPWIIAGVAVLIAGVVLLIVLLPDGNSSAGTAAATGEKSGTPAVVSGKDADKTEEVSVEEQLRAALRSDSPDLKELSAMVLQTPNPNVYKTSLIKEFERQFGKAESNEAKIALFEAVSLLKWAELEERRKSFYDGISGELHNAVEALDFAEIKRLYPLAQQIGAPRLAQAKILLDAEPVLLRRDPAEIRNFIAACPDAYVKKRLETRVKNNFHQKIRYLQSGVRRSLAMGDLQEAQWQYSELASIAPDERETVELRQILENARNSAHASGNNARNSAPRHPGIRRGGRHPHARGGMPLHIQLTRACMMGQREEVSRLMAQKPDLHRTMKVMDSATGQTHQTTVFQSLLKRGKNMTGSRKEAFCACLIVILESGYQPDAAEKKYMNENYSDLMQFIR